ncbi:hypothetical protein, partial [Escherichia coli]|uniref:hypothetical protein n=1 Tax=Escherichia coli TaxID=562 RepID=UPI00192A68E0
EETSEAVYTVYVVCERDRQSEVHERLVDMLEQASYPARTVDQHAFGEDETELEAQLFATAVVPEQLDDVVHRLSTSPGVVQAFWSSGSDS